VCQPRSPLHHTMGPRPPQQSIVTRGGPSSPRPHLLSMAVPIQPSAATLRDRARANPVCGISMARRGAVSYRASVSRHHRDHSEKGPRIAIDRTGSSSASTSTAPPSPAARKWYHLPPNICGRQYEGSRLVDDPIAPSFPYPSREHFRNWSRPGQDASGTERHAAPDHHRRRRRPLPEPVMLLPRPGRRGRKPVGKSHSWEHGVDPALTDPPSQHLANPRQRAPMGRDTLPAVARAAARCQSTMDPTATGRIATKCSTPLNQRVRKKRQLQQPDWLSPPCHHPRNPYS
jgi:hypothetical protein